MTRGVHDSLLYSIWSRKKKNYCQNASFSCNIVVWHSFMDIIEVPFFRWPYVVLNPNTNKIFERVLGTSCIGLNHLSSSLQQSNEINSAVRMHKST